MFEAKPKSTLEQFLQQVEYVKDLIKSASYARSIPNRRKQEALDVYIAGSGGTQHYKPVNDVKELLAERYRLDGVQDMKTTLRGYANDIDAIRDILIWLASNAVVELGQVTREIREYADNAE
jgi:hypothetical protein